MNTKTFKEFQKSRRRVESIQIEFGFNDLEMGETDQPGYVYDDCCYIIIEPNEKYSLIIERSDYLSKDLQGLEEILYRDWYKDNY